MTPHFDGQSGLLLSRNLIRWSYAEARRLLELASSSRPLEEVAHLMRKSPAAIYKMAGHPLRHSVEACRTEAERDAEIMPHRKPRLRHSIPT